MRAVNENGAVVEYPAPDSLLYGDRSNAFECRLGLLDVEDSTFRHYFVGIKFNDVLFRHDYSAYLYD